MTDKEKKHPLLIEIGCEDLPPFDQTIIQQSGSEVFKNILKEKRIKSSPVKVMAAPRRIAITAQWVVEFQQKEHEKIKGPPATIAVKDGSPTKAGLGFARKMGVQFKDLKKEEISGSEYYFFVEEKPRLSLKDMLGSIISEFLENLKLNESMRWPGAEVKFVRPVRWITAKLGSSSLDFKFENIKSSPFTRGHYIFADRKVKVEDASGYEEVLKDNYVLVDHEKRKKALLKTLNDSLKDSKSRIVKNEKLLEEINNSTEYPTAVKGKFSKKYLRLPRIIIEACLIYHQKYFPVEDEKNNLLNYFVAVRDGLGGHLDQIRKGYEKVLVARLEDADFFLKKDRRKPLIEHVEGLKGIEFTRGLGTLYDKARRIKGLASEIAFKLNKDEKFKKDLARAALLVKADLSSAVVNEFPELEGKAGSVYAEMDGENKKVSESIYQHYLPVDFEDVIPALDEAAAVGIADRLDTIAGNVAKGVKASGSRDPFGIRKVCRGMLRILVEKNWLLNLNELILNSLELYKKGNVNFSGEARSDIEDFIKSMRDNMLLENFPHDTARCVSSGSVINPAESFIKARAVEKIRAENDLDSIAAAFKRINNIIRQAGDKNIEIDKKYDERKFVDSYEKKLGALFKQYEKKVENYLKENDFESILKLLCSLKESIDAFFDHVLVMDPNKDLMKNRLALLNNIIELFSPAGDISQLEIKNK
ncbi:MAG: glycine--tRNA ligase subunit beta [Elusimicrobiota bacterium]